jgi:hypothetical protein
MSDSISRSGVEKAFIGWRSAPLALQGLLTTLSQMPAAAIARLRPQAQACPVEASAAAARSASAMSSSMEWSLRPEASPSSMACCNSFSLRQSGDNVHMLM